MAVNFNDLFGLGSLGNSLGAQNAFCNEFERVRQLQLEQMKQQARAERVAQTEQRAWESLYNAHPGMWIRTNKVSWPDDYWDFDKNGKSGIDAMEEGPRPIVALRREIEGWLPKL